MSTGRYCDVQIAPDCPSRPPYHGVFSELAEGWETGSGTRVMRDERGRRTDAEVSQDCCPACVNVRSKRYAAPEPPPAAKSIQGAVVGKHVVDDEEYQGYLSYLERQALGDAAP